MPSGRDPAREAAYRIFLAVGDADVPSAASHARDLLDKAFQKSELHIVGSASGLERLKADDPTLEAAFRMVPLPPNTNQAAALGLVLLDYSDRDFIFVKAGVVLPEDWDVRLAWTAQRVPGAATVAPVFADELRALGIESAAPPDHVGLDRLCYHSSYFGLVETSGYREDCVYVRGEAARAAQISMDVPPADRPRLFAANVKRLRYSHVVADHVCAEGVSSAPRTRLHELSFKLAFFFEILRGNSSPLGVPGAPPVRDSMRPRLLRVLHSWGGGMERCARESCRADRWNDNLVLKPVGRSAACGLELALYRHVDDPQPVETWPLSPAIQSTALEHAGYKAALAEIVHQYGIEGILVSSLIGHSLDALGTGLPTVIICHDYYPFCPALNITFGEVCQSCTARDLAACTLENPHHRFFPNTPPEQWMNLRSAFLRRIEQANLTLIAPSPSVRDNYARLNPDLAGRFQVIPHGSRPLPSGPLTLNPASTEASGRRLRLLILGSLALNKGGALVRSIGKDLARVADLFLVGCGRDFAFGGGATVIPEYAWESLPEILRGVAPDLALLPSVVPETFSLTLQELFELAVPTLATDLGSFHDRIEDGVNGFLCRPEAPHVLARVKELAADREALARVHLHLRSSAVRRLPEMLADYREVLRIPAVSSKAYFCPDSRMGPASTGRKAAHGLPIERLARDLSLAAARVVEMETSVSWKMSRPLRILGAMYLKAAGILKKGSRKRPQNP